MRDKISLSDAVKQQMMHLIDLIICDNSHKGARFAANIFNAWKDYTAPTDLGFVGDKEDER